MPQRIKCLCFHTRMNILNKLNLRCNKARQCNIKLIKLKVIDALRQSGLVWDVAVLSALSELPKPRHERCSKWPNEWMNVHLSSICYNTATCVHRLSVNIVTRRSQRAEPTPGQERCHHEWGSISLCDIAKGWLPGLCLFSTHLESGASRRSNFSNFWRTFAEYGTFKVNLWSLLGN